MALQLLQRLCADNEDLRRDVTRLRRALLDVGHDLVVAVEQLMPSKTLYSPSQAAQLLGTTKEDIEQCVDAGVISAQQWFPTTRIHVADLYRAAAGGGLTVESPQEAK